RPGQFGCCRGRGAFGGNRDTPRRACREVDVIRRAPGLADELEFRQAGEQIGSDRRALTHGQQRVGIGEPFGLGVERGHGVVMDVYIEMFDKRRIAVQRTDAVLVVVGNNHFHAVCSLVKSSTTGPNSEAGFPAVEYNGPRPSSSCKPSSPGPLPWPRGG